MKSLITAVALVLLCAASAIGQDVSCNSSTIGGTSTSTCRSTDGFYVGISCSGSTCSAETGGPSGTVYVPSLVGVPLETGYCDQACKDRLRHRDEVAVKRAAIMRAIAAKYCSSGSCNDGELVSIYNSLSYCEAHRLPVDDERKYCPADVVNDPLRAMLDLTAATK